MTRKALGKGLNALLPELPTNQTESLLEIDIDLIVPNKVQPRTFFDESLLNELSQSIKENGVVQPILLRNIGENKYEIVAGERRWRAAQRAGIKKIPAVVRQIPNEKMLELALIENIQRQELNAIEEAQAYKSLIVELGLTQEILAHRIGRDRTYITNYLRLLRLSVEVQRMIETGKLSMGHGRALVPIEDATLQNKVAFEIVEKNLSVRETEKRVKQLAESPLPETPKPLPSQMLDPNVRAAEDKIRRHLGTRVRVITNNDGASGKIEIHYNDMKDLIRIYDIMVKNKEMAH